MNNAHKNIDWSLILLTFTLFCIGWINIYSTTSESYNEFSFNFNSNYCKQLIWIGSAVILALFTMVINYRFFLVLPHRYIYYSF